MRLPQCVASLAGLAMAFPAMDESTAPFYNALANNVGARQVLSGPQGAGFLPLVPPPFNAEEQRVSVSGAHRFIPPGPGDERGQCPGLNALANHGYLPRNGRATIQQFINGTNTGLGMAFDIGTFLAVFGATADGDGKSWSIGGRPHTGILGSHNDYESDSSPLKSDLNQYGSNTRLIMSQFKNLYNRQSGPNANYNLEVLRDFRKSRFDESVAKNPYYTYLPFTGTLVSQAAFTFIYRFMANKSAEYPEGVLNQNVLKSFMSIQGEGNNMRWVPGHERIPENWYKRNKADEYGQIYFQTDLNQFAAKYPEILTSGCNQGKVNSYLTFEPQTLTSGVYTASSVAANPLCYGIEFAMGSLPALTGLSASQLASARKALAASGLQCAAIPNANLTALKACPGFSFYGGPTGQVAPGAIQS